MADNQSIIHKKIGLQQVLLHDSSVFSIQWMVLPTSYINKLSPSDLLERYLQFIKRFTFSIIRPVRSESEVEFRLLNTRISLINFTGPSFRSEENQASVTLSICGGVLVQPENCQRGELEFSTKIINSGLKVILQLSDFCPMLLGNNKPSMVRKFVYRITQAYIHKIVTVKFLSRLYFDLEGLSPRIKIVRVNVKEGEKI